MAIKNDYLPEDQCYIYINTARFQGREICKVGITNNIRKRLNEFNNGLRYRKRFYPKITGVQFDHFFKVKISNRSTAKKIELNIKRKLCQMSIYEFGNEVFFITAEQMRGLIFTQIRGSHESN